MPGYKGQQGRKPKPSTIVERERKLGIDPLEKPPSGLPTCPFHTGKHQADKEACRAWHRLVKELNSVGLIGRLDSDALTLYCRAWSRWVEAEDRLREFGPVIFDHQRNRPVLSPYWRVANTAMDQMKSLLGEFGLTPASRSRLPKRKPEERPRHNPPAPRYQGDPRDVLRVLS
jgi:P27 family predicted phage terminase small subunit